MHNELLQICQKLHAKGLKPSVALLRARSSSALSIPQAVKAVQQWQALAKTEDLPALSSLIEDPDAESLTSESKVAKIEKRLHDLEDEIAAIRLLLQQL